MIASGADLHVGEVRGRVCRRHDFDRRSPPISHPVIGRPVAEHAFAVVSPGVGVSVAAQSQRLLPSAVDLHVGEIRRRVCRLSHLDRRIPVDFRPVGELAIGVVSPCVGVSVAAQGQRMILSGADLHVGEIRRRVCRLAHPARRNSWSGRPVAELAIRVVSPCVGVSVAAQGQRMPTSGADLHVGEVRGRV